MMNKVKKFYLNHQKVIILSLIILGTMLLTIGFISVETDYWWHIKAGKYMVENNIILKKDVFSWYASQHNLSWISHEWLTEVILYVLSLLFKNSHVIIYCITLWLLTILTVFLSNKKKFLNNIKFTIIFLVFSILLLSVCVMPRPHMFSFFFFVLSLTLLFDLLRNEKSNKIFFLPLITLIWANVHGGSSNLSYILSFTFLFVGNFKFSFGKIESNPFTKLQLKKYLIVTLLSILAITINPHGLQMLVYPYQNMQDTFMLKTISEWQPSNPNQLSHLSIFIFIGYLFIVIFKSNKKLQLLDALLLSMFGFLSLKSIRFWPFLYLVSSYIIFDYIKKRNTSNYSNLILLLTSIIFCILMIPMIRNVGKTYTPLDDSFITKIREVKPDKLYNYYDYGGYLIYKDIKVFIDGRADMYSKYNYHDYYNLSNLRGNFKQILDHYQFDMFLLDKGIPLSFYLKDTEDYEIVLEKGNTILYKLK